MVEHIFALTVPLGIKGGDSDDLPALLGPQISRLPASVFPDRPAGLQGVQEPIGRERINRSPIFGASTSIPIGLSDLGNSWVRANFDRLVCHGATGGRLRAWVKPDTLQT